MGDETHQKLTLRGLQSAAGFLQAKIAKGIDIRYTPKLSFLLDQGVKRSIAVAQILQQVLPPKETATNCRRRPSERIAQREEPFRQMKIGNLQFAFSTVPSEPSP